MMKTETQIQFFLPMLPPTVTHQMKGIRWETKKFFERPEVADARAKFTAHLGAHRPAAPLSGPVRLTTRWIFPLKGKHFDGEYKISRPDTDNSLKLLKDVMTALDFWTDDAQVASELTEKFWGETPGIFIRVESL